MHRFDGNSILLTGICVNTIKLMIPPKSARLHESGLLDECAPQILRCAQDDKPPVILSAAKDLLPLLAANKLFLRLGGYFNLDIIILSPLINEGRDAPTEDKEADDDVAKRTEVTAQIA